MFKCRLRKAFFGDQYGLLKIGTSRETSAHESVFHRFIEEMNKADGLIIPRFFANTLILHFCDFKPLQSMPYFEKCCSSTLDGL